MTDLEHIKALKHGEHYTIPESDYGKAEVHRIRDRYLLFEIPQFGGEPAYYGTYWVNSLEHLIKDVESWT